MLLTSPTIDDISNYQYCLQEKHMVEYVYDWQPTIAKYFDNIDDQIKSLKIIYCESKGKANAVGKNRDGTKDVGLWQFNDDTWAWLTPKLNLTSNRTNPEVSTAVAAWLIKHDGWHHWNSSKHCWENK
tara:strand:+ start:2627 stop:3010 length:384 start_codon:yes stop_codon:yes gene_type:complete